MKSVVDLKFQISVVLFFASLFGIYFICGADHERGRLQVEQYNSYFSVQSRKTTRIKHGDLQLKFLIDTNVFIPLEPSTTKDLEQQSVPTATLSRLAIEQKHQIYLHPCVSDDLDDDKDKSRQELRFILAKKYPALINSPPVSRDMIEVLGDPSRGTNDWVDNQLLAALKAEAVDFIVTEDRQLHRKAVRIGLKERVATIQEAISIIKDFSDSIPNPPPAVLPVKAYELERSDPIFASFRNDYPNFDKWLTKCMREHRQAWKIDNPEGKLAGFCIINPEKNPPRKLRGKVLKLCSFKISEHSNGFRFGELLLKPVFDYAIDNKYDWMYVTVFEKYQRVIQLFEDFGFDALDYGMDLGELIMVKPMDPKIVESRSLNPLDFNIRFGPFYFRADTPRWFVIPIQKRFSDFLFPETKLQKNLFAGNNPFGNAIRKAYLSKSQIRTLPAGSVLMFYRSGLDAGAISIGIVEFCIRSKSADEIARTVGKRTVYTFQDIENLCGSKGSVLAILFRQSRILENTIKSKELKNGDVFVRPPQSIMEIQSWGKRWLQEKLKV